MRKLISKCILQWTCLGAALLIIGGVHSHAQAFKAEGRTKYQVFNQGKLVYSNTNNFTAEVSGCDWLIRTVPLGKGPDDTLDYTEMHHRHGEIKMIYAFISKTNKSVTNIIVKVEGNDVPEDDGSTISHLWLGYASACYFASVTNGLLKPVWMLDDGDLRFENFQVQGNWILNNSAPKLPDSVVYFSDGNLRLKRGGGERLTLKAPGPFSSGYTNAIYTVLGWTNFGSAIEVPHRFVFQRYGTKVDATTNTDLAIINLVEVYTETLKPIGLNSTLNPEVTGIAHVADRRFFPPIRNIEYKVKDGAWQTKERIVLTPEYARLKRVSGPSLPTQERLTKKVYFLVVFGVLLLGPMVFLAVARKQAGNIKQNEKELK